MTKKRCIDCGLVKLLDEFYKGRGMKDGRLGRCKSCHSEYGKRHYKENAEAAKARVSAYYAQNKEKARAASREWAKRNPDKVKAAQHRYVSKNPDKVKAARHKYASKNRDKLAAINREWSARNPEKRRLYNVNRRARYAGAEGSHTNDEWIQLCEQHAYKCAICKRDDVLMTRDHIISLSKGGSNYIENLQPLCLSCNCRKQNN